MMRAFASIGIGLSFVAGFAMACAIGACSPSQRETVREVVPPVTKAVCVVLRAIGASGKMNEICARAEDLLPFFDDIVALKEARGGEVPARAELAFVLESPPKPVARRKCLAWVELERDGGADGGR